MNLGWKLAAEVDQRAQLQILDTDDAERLPFACKLVAATTDDTLFTTITSRKE